MKYNTTPPAEPAPPMTEEETKADRFKRLANYRVTKVLERLDQITHLSNRAQYDYTPEQIDKIERTLIDRVTETLAGFKGRAEKSSFEL